MNSESNLILCIPRALAKELNDRATELCSHVQFESDVDLQATSDFYFQSTLLLGAIHIEGREQPAHRVKTILNPEGQETARYFPLDVNESEWAGFVGESFDAFLALCHQLHELEAVSQVISFTFLVEVAFEWFHYANSNTESPQSYDFTTAVVATCESEIDSFEIWIPIQGMEFSGLFRVGQVEFKKVTIENLNTWRRQWGARWPAEEHPHRALVDKFFIRVSAQLAKSLPVAKVQLRAEPVRAVERGLDEVERTLSILRFFSRANFYPLGKSYCAIEGTAHESSSHYILLQDGVLTSAGRVSQKWPDFPLEKFNILELAQMRAAGLDTLHSLLQLEDAQRTPFERQLLKALDIYAKSSLTSNTSDKLLYIVVALESIFIFGEEGSLRKRVAERLAFLLGNSLGERRAIIEIYTAAYRARSNVVHRGENPQDRTLLKEFLNLAWHTFRHLIQNSKQFQSQSEMLNSLDETKFR